MRKRHILLAILLILSSVDSAMSYSGFLFVHIVNGVPYVIVDNPEQIDRLQKLLLFSFLNDGKLGDGQSVLLNTDFSEPVPHLFLFADFEATHRWVEITGPDEITRQVVGFKNGDKLAIQSVTTDGSGAYHEIEVDKVLFHPSEYYSRLILRCKPVSFHKDSENLCKPTSFGTGLENSGIYCPYVAYSADYSFEPWPPGIPRSPLKTQVPTVVKEEAGRLTKRFFKSVGSPAQRIASLQPFRYFHDDQGQTYYALVVCRQDAIDDKGYAASTWILDNRGKIFRRLNGNGDRSRPGYTYVLGITDADRNGTHEVIFLYGNSYGGGVELVYLSFDWDGKEDRLQLRAGPRATTMLD